MPKMLLNLLENRDIFKGKMKILILQMHIALQLLAVCVFVKPEFGAFLIGGQKEWINIFLTLLGRI